MSASAFTRKSITCAWCGQVVLLSPRGTPKQHKDGKKMCEGSLHAAEEHHRHAERTRKSSKKASATTDQQTDT